MTITGLFLHFHIDLRTRMLLIIRKIKPRFMNHFPLISPSLAAVAAEAEEVAAVATVAGLRAKEAFNEKMT